MTTIDMRGSKKDINTILDEYSLKLAEEIVNGICAAIDKGASMVTCLQIITDDDIVSYVSSYSLFESSLRKNIVILANAELYELCQKALNYANKISQKLLTDKIK